MAKDDDLNNMFLSSEVADLNWLDVDEDAYRAVDTLPKQNLDTAPDLQKLWDHSTNPVNVGRETEMVVHREPVMAGGTQVGDIAVTAMDREQNTQTIAQVVKFANELLMSGVPPIEFAAGMKQHFTNYDLALAKDELGKLASEVGVLGHVYVDPKIFDRCHLGEGRKVIAQAKNAKYLLAKPACSDCSMKKQGRCDVYKKQVVDQVPYSDKLVAQYQQLYAAQGKTASVTGATPKEKIRSLVVFASEVTEQRLDNKPVVKPAEPKISTEEALVQIGSKKTEREHVASVAHDRLYRAAALKMMSRSLGNELRAKLATVDHPRLEVLRREEGLVGNVWVDLGPFDNCEVQAKSFLAKHAKTATHVTKTSRCTSCPHFKQTRCALFERDIVTSGVDYTDDLAKKHILAALKRGDIDKRVASVLAKSLKDKGARDVLKALYAYEKPAEVAVYAGHVPEKKAVSPTELALYMREAEERRKEETRPVDVTVREYEPVVATIRDGLKQGLNGPLLQGILKEKYSADLLARSRPFVAAKLAEEGLLDKLREGFTQERETLAAENPVSEFGLQSVGNFDLNAESRPEGSLDFQLGGGMIIDD